MGNGRERETTRKRSRQTANKFEIKKMIKAQSPISRLKGVGKREKVYTILRPFSKRPSGTERQREQRAHLHTRTSYIHTKSVSENVLLAY